MRKNFASIAFGAISLVLLGSSCSLVYDLNPDQCASNDDCVARFGKGYTCDLGICASPTSSSGRGGSDDSSGGATAGTDASSDAGKTGKGGSSGAAPTGGDAGMAGATVVEPRCTSHKQCFTLYPDDAKTNPRACVDGTCVPLMSPDCPAVLPLSDNGTWSLLKSSDAIILGAYAPISGGTLDTITNNYDLAVTELHTSAGGVFAGNANRREIVVVVCNDIYDTPDELLPPSKHLMEDLQVPGVVGALLLQDQKYVWENVAQPAGTFMMIPLPSDQELIDAKDDGLLWYMLSGANALSVSYQPLLDMTVQHLKALGTLGASESLKVAHVKANDQAFMQDTGLYLEANLQFNGQSTSDNLDAGFYKPIQVTSSISAPDDMQTGAINSILTFAPHIVIGSTASEMLTYIIPGVESGWAAANPGMPHPFYILGTGAYNDPEMSKLINHASSYSGSKPLYQRILGLNWPAAADQTVYKDYQARWISANGARQDGYENFYDAMYYLMYAVAGAPAPLLGKSIVTGMTRIDVIGGGATPLNVGPGDDMSTAITTLSGNSKAKIEVIGAGGPPNWDVYGARNDPASVWCVNTVGAFLPDQLRYDTSTSTLKPSDTTLAPSDIKCFTFPAQ